jgi:ribonuclease VapC
MASVVLDASAVLAVINDELGADIVIDRLDDAMLSAVNHAEVVSKLVERGVSLGLATAAVRRIGVRVIDFDIELADRTGDLRRYTKPFGLSLADRACLALAERERVLVMTADRRWSVISIGVEVRLIR